MLHLKTSLDRQMGGSVTALVSVAAATAIAGDRPCVLALRRPGDDLSLVEQLDERVERVLVRQRRAMPYGLSLPILWWLWRNVREFDLVEAHEVFAFPTFASALLCRLRSVPWVLHPHNSLDPYDLAKHDRLKRVLRPGVRFMLRSASGVWLTTKTESDRLDDHGVSINRVVSPLPVEAPRFVGDRERFRTGLGLGDDDFALLFLGRIDRKKGLTRTIAAVERLPRHVHLVVAGSGDDERLTSELDTRVYASPARNRIHRVGYLVDQEVADAFAGADLFVLHSDNENFGLAPVEAAMSGLPSVLSSDVMVAQDLADAGIAVVVPTRDEDELVETLEELATRQDRYSELLGGATTATLPFGAEAVAATDAALRRRVRDMPRASSAFIDGKDV